jgi:carbamoyl-phosphate synthase small subunit
MEFKVYTHEMSHISKRSSAESQKELCSRQMISGQLILASGETFEGYAPNWQKDHSFFGEVVFTTGMTGYVESLTDPSYAGQILTFTYPLIGNYGVPESSAWESARIQAKGVIISEEYATFHHFEGKSSFREWLFAQKVPFLSGIDTRALTKRLRSSGVALGALTSEKNFKAHFFDPNASHLVAQVSVKTPIVYGNGKKKVIAIDCGMKENIVRSLSKLPLTVKRVPHDYNFLNEEYDGLFISNGPGDPTQCLETIALLRAALTRKKPIFGICLGTQLLSLALGAKTYKLPYGHRGQNQPCSDEETGRCYLTSQNHGYAVEEKSLPEEWRVSFRNLNDCSVEGIAHRHLPFFAVQFHPEASPGPVETQWLFQKFYTLL